MVIGARLGLTLHEDHSLLRDPDHAHKSLYNFLGRISLLQ